MNEFSLIETEDPRIEYLQTLIARKTSLQKQIRGLKHEYVRLLGDLLLHEHTLRVEIIRLKKETAWIVARINSGSVVDEDELEEYSLKVMETYYEELQELHDSYQHAKISQQLADGELAQIRRLYRHMAKRLHPDLHPEFETSEEMRNLWDLIQDAYIRNDLESLEQYSVLVNELDQNGSLPDDLVLGADQIEEKIASLEDEIAKLADHFILSEEVWMDDPVQIEAKRKTHEDEIAQLERYRQSFQQKKDALLMQKGSGSCPIH